MGERHPSEFYNVKEQEIAGVAWVASEKEVTIRHLVQEFKLAHKNIWEETRVIMMDKDFVEMKIFEREFPLARSLLCIFHVLKAVKTRVAKDAMTAVTKQQVLTLFRRCMYAYSEEVFDVRWEEMRDFDEMPVTLVEYFTDNWLPIRSRWALFDRRHLTTMGNTTNNRMERFNRMFKETLKERRRTVPKLAECIQVFMEVMNVKENTTTYMRFMQGTTRLRVRHPVYNEFFDVIGQQLTDFACRLVVTETLRFHRQQDQLTVEDWGSGN